MKKAILYLIFLVLLFSNSKAHAVVSSPDAKIKVTIHKIHNENTANRGVSKRGSFSHKADLLIDFDDNEEYDTENNSVSSKGKHSCSIISFLSDNKSVYPIAKPFYTNSYKRHNFSRLPRFTHISLRVLLI
jgi:two-component sensor histidine kinase